MSMPDHNDDPVAAAGAKVASYLSLATVAAEAIAQLAAARARERAVTDERTAAALRAQRQAAYSQARLGWAPILDPKLRGRTGVLDAGLVWAKAQAWRPDPAAERASDLAEDRLRDLRPDVMERYDRLRAEGADPVEAMRRVAPGFDAPPMWTGQPGPARTALTEQDASRRPGDAEITRVRLFWSDLIVSVRNCPATICGGGRGMAGVLQPATTCSNSSRDRPNTPAASLLLLRIPLAPLLSHVLVSTPTNVAGRSPSNDQVRHKTPGHTQRRPHFRGAAPEPIGLEG